MVGKYVSERHNFKQIFISLDLVFKITYKINTLPNYSSKNNILKVKIQC